MEKYFSKPKIVISACLGFKKCRYNGNMENTVITKRLKDYVDFIPVCPEESIGFDTPRLPLRIVKNGEKITLIQHKTGEDYYRKMVEFSNEFLGSLKEIDGFIMKSRSPSCGTKDVKIYASAEKGASFNKGKGIFSEIAIIKYPNLAIEDEGRLKNYLIRDFFYTKLFALANFRSVKKSKSKEELVKFHTHNLFLFKTYNKKRTQQLQKLIDSTINFKEIIDEYEKCLGLVFARLPRTASKINILSDIEGKYISNKKEKEYIDNSLREYEEKKVPYSVPLNLVRASLYRRNSTIVNQSIFNPFPHGLVDVTDSGKGRDISNH